jgi:purine-binding chemotaxis protein CheW
MADASNSLQQRVVMLGLGDEIFAVEASMVREILDPVPVTRVPGAPDFAPGVINVRGAILPLADLRVRFGMQAGAQTQDTRFLVLEIEETGEDGPLVAGIVADRVYEVTDIEEPPASTIPKLGMNWSPDLVRGVALWKGEFVIVPDLAAILH